MKFPGFLLLVSGAIIVLAALGLLQGAASRLAFIGAGLALEIVGVVLVALAHRSRGGVPL